MQILLSSHCNNLIGWSLISNFVIESIKWSIEMISEIYRVLSSGGIYLTFSLHYHQDILHYFKNTVFNWRVTAYRVRNHRWDEENNSRRNVAHTLIICEKPGIDGNYRSDYSSSLPGVLSEEDYNQLEDYSMRVSTVEIENIENNYLNIIQLIIAI